MALSSSFIKNEWERACGTLVVISDGGGSGRDCRYLDLLRSQDRLRCPEVVIDVTPEKEERRKRQVAATSPGGDVSALFEADRALDL